MLKTSTNFDTYNTALHSKPVWIIKFSFSATYFSSGTFADIGSYTVKKIAGSLTHIGMNVDMLNFHTDFGGYDFTLIDIDDEVRTITSEDIINDSITIYTGFQELELADFITLPESKIKSWGLNDDLMTYWFKSRIDLLPTKPIFQNMGKTFLTAKLPVAAVGEHLNETDFATTTKWAVVQDFSFVGTEAVYVHNTGAGALTQVKANLNIEGTGELLYKFQYDVTALTGSPTLQLQTAFSESLVDIPITSVANDKTVYFKSAVKPTDFQLIGTSAAGENFTLDNLRLNIPNDVIQVDSTLVLQSPGLPPWDLTGTRKSYINVGGEIIEYTSKTNPIIVLDRTDTNGTRKKEHSENTEVFEVMYINNVADGSGIPEAFDFLASVLTTTQGGANGDYDKGTGTWGNNWGLGIDESVFDWIDMKNQFQKMASQSGIPWIRHIYLIDSKTGFNDGLKWIEDVLLANYPAYFFMTFNGKVSIRFFDIYDNKDGVVTLTTDDIVNISIDNRKQDVVTHVNITYGVGDTKRVQEVQNNTSNTKWGELKKLITKYDYFDLSGSVPAYFSRFIERVFSKFGNPTIRTKFNTKMDFQTLQVGDVIDLTYDKMPVFTDGSLGWTREAFEIVNKEITYQADKIEPKFEAINSFLNKKVDVSSVIVYEQSDMVDDDLTRNSDHAAGTLQGADAYINVNHTSVDAVMVELTLTEPAVGGGTDEYIEFYIKIQNPAGTDITDGEVKKFMWYDEGGSVNRKNEFMICGLGNATVTCVRVDFTAFSGTVAQEPVLKLSKVKIIKYNYTSTSTDL